MSILLEIEAAAESLPPEQQQELPLFLASRLRADGRVPEPRQFPAEQVASWITDDDSDMRRFNGGK